VKASTPNVKTPTQIELVKVETTVDEELQAVTSPTSPYSLRQTRQLSWKMIDHEISNAAVKQPEISQQQREEEVIPQTAKASSPKPGKKAEITAKQLSSETDPPQDTPVDGDGVLQSPKSEQVKHTAQSPPDNLLRRSLRSFRLSQSSNSDEQQQQEEAREPSSSCKLNNVKSEFDNVTSPIMEYCSRLRPRSGLSPPISQPSVKQMVTKEEPVIVATSEDEPVTVVNSEAMMIKDDTLPSFDTDNNMDTLSSVTEQQDMAKDKDEEEEVEVIIVEAPQHLPILPSPSQPVISIAIDNQESVELAQEDVQAVIVESFDDEQDVTNNKSPVLPAVVDNICSPVTVNNEIPVKNEIPVNDERSQQKFRKRLHSHSSSDGSDPSLKRMKPMTQDGINDNNSISERLVKNYAHYYIMIVILVILVTLVMILQLT